MLMIRTAMVLITSLILGLPAVAAVPDSFEEFQGTVNSGVAALEEGKVSEASKQLIQAEKLYQATLTALAKDNSQDAEAHRQALRSNLVLLYLQLGQALNQAEQSTEALELYARARRIAPDSAMIPYLIGTLQAANKEQEAAATSFRLARRLARFPALRDLPNPLVPDAGLFGDYTDFDTHIAERLSELGLPVTDPLEIDLMTGRKHPGLAVPGMGAQVSLTKGGRWHNVYLGADLGETSDTLGKAKGSQVLTNGADSRIELGYPGFTLDFDLASSSLQGLYLYDEGQTVSVPGGMLSVGDGLTKIKARLGEGYGYQLEPLDDASLDMKAFVNYPQLGLSFGLSQVDQVVVILLYRPQ